MPEYLPVEIWLHIANFIPEEHLRNMLDVNRLFFDIAMDIRYRKIEFSSQDQDTFLKTLAPLREPGIAKRVKSLHVQFNHPARNVEQPRLTVSRIAGALHLPYLSRSSRKRGPTRIPFEAMVNNLAGIFPGMMNLAEFSVIDSWNWREGFNLEPFFSAAWSSFGRSLQKLSLSGNIEWFGSLTATKPVLNSLQDLELEFTNSLSRLDTNLDSISTDVDTLVHSVTPFINRLAPQLSRFKVWSWASADLSEFFKGVGPLPVLRAFSIRAAFDRSFRDASSLTQFLSHHSATLKDMELRLNPTGFINPLTDNQLSQWLSEVIQDERFATGLRTFQLYPSSTATGFNSLVVCIQRSADSLKRLIVRDHYNHYEEVVRIATAFSSTNQLSYLRLNVWRLSGKLFDLLAKSFPNLKELTLNVSEDVTQQEFASQMSSRIYDDWRLYDLGIWQNGAEMDHESMRLLGNSIPSVISFWGEGPLIVGGD